MRDLIILGTGVHAAEMAQMVSRLNRERPTWNLVGHIAPKNAKAGDDFFGKPVLGGFEALAGYPDAQIVCDNEFPKSVSLPEDRLISLVDPSCFVHPNVRIGAGTVLYPHCFVGVNARLGSRVFVLAGCVINHDDAIGDRAVLASGVVLAGFVTVEEDCYLGQGCMVRQSLRVGRKSLIGMGAVVCADVESNVVMVGNPARKLRDRG